MLIEVPKHRSSGDECKKSKCKCMLPINLEEIFIGEKQPWKENDDDKRCNTECDISVKTKCEYKSRKSECGIFFRAQSFEEKIESKRKYERHHDSAKTDAGEVYGPK